ncbi:cell division protein FtsW [Acidihalobacter aeolianus]|uniref:Probable peptidoglycan glycosyltransferase FtsW n=1 Tax=Acidihalobacter aeolianus TaxID=2792603 RepID=A0A1D8KAC4_9GAMM|nr:cell division protein FtsW [Acidihalobacter aeolianus]
MASIPADLRLPGLARRLEGLLSGAVDMPMLLVSFAILGLGLVMVASSSVSVAARETGNPFYFFDRQAIYALLGIGAAMVAFHTRLVLWERSGMALLLFTYFLLVVVLIPGIGHQVNGSIRWIGFGPFNIQVSEPTKLFMAIYLAGFLVRREREVCNTFWGFARPMLVMVIAAFLLLREPDYGSAVTLMAMGLGMLFLGGARLTQFALFLLMTMVAVAVLAVSSPYRVERLTGFLNPWAHPYSSGYQLTQSLIAIGGGSWWGMGLGESVQKLFYLPEAHNDFLFAVLAEELGLVGIVLVVALFAVLVYRGFRIGARAAEAGNHFSANLAYGLTIWIGMQAFINMAVNMGILPTKGLTLPLMSYGGSSMLVNCMALGFLQRIHRETVEGSAVAVRTRGRAGRRT